jgi:hypothetical protein
MNTIEKRHMAWWSGIEFLQRFASPWVVSNCPQGVATVGVVKPPDFAVVFRSHFLNSGKASEIFKILIKPIPSQRKQ